MVETVTCKFVVDSVLLTQGGEEIKMSAVTYASKEDNSYSKWTPSGSFTIFVTNENLFGHFKPGSKHYFTITPADKGN